MTTPLYERGKLLAESRVSSVYVYFNQKGSCFAGKVINKSLYKSWEKECKILDRVGQGNDNVVRYFPIIEQCDSYVVLCMELCNGDLEKYIFNKDIIQPNDTDLSPGIPAREFFETTLHDVCFQAVKGLHYLHINHRIIHRDVKPTNFLLLRTPDSKTLVKIADFGLSRDVPENSSFHHSITTSSGAFMAPECQDRKWNLASDIFSLGILLYFAFTDGCYPYQNGSCNQKPDFSMLREINNYSNEQVVTMIDLIKRMIKRCPKDRLNVDEVYHHPTFWESKKKIEFYKTVKDHVESQDNPEFLDELNKFDSELLDDRKEGSNPFDISKRNISSFLKTQTRERRRNIRCRNVQELLRVIRNVEAHLFDAGNSEEFRSLFGIQGEAANRDQVLLFLTGDFPQLLVHLYEFFRFRNVAVRFYPTPNDSSLLPRGSSSHERSSVETDLPSIVAGLDPVPDWRNFFENNYHADESVCDFEFTLKYFDKAIKNRHLKIRQQSLKVFHSPDASNSINPSENEFLFPAERNSIINQILSNFTDGIVLSTDELESNLFVTRKCLVQVFFSSHCQRHFVKLERNKRTKLFSHEDLHRQFKKSGGPSQVRHDIKLVIGTDPDVHDKPPVVLLIKPTVAASVMENLNSTNVLVSL